MQNNKSNHSETLVNDDFFKDVVLFIIFNSSYLFRHCNEEYWGKFQHEDSA